MNEAVALFYNFGVSAPPPPPPRRLRRRLRPRRRAPTGRWFWRRKPVRFLRLRRQSAA